jgi:hypothetical protein
MDYKLYPPNRDQLMHDDISVEDHGDLCKARISTCLIAGGRASRGRDTSMIIPPDLVDMRLNAYPPWVIPTHADETIGFRSVCISFVTASRTQGAPRPQNFSNTLFPISRSDVKPAPHDSVPKHLQNSALASFLRP